MKQEKSMLHSMLFELEKMIGKSRIYLKTFEEIGLNSERMQSSYFSQSFGIMQMMAFSSIANEVYNIFDNHPTYEIISIPKILKELEHDSYQVENSRLYRKKLAILGIKLSEADSNLKSESIITMNASRPNSRDNETLKQIRHVRHNFVSHRNIEVIGQNSQSLPQSEKIELLFEWAENFRQAIYGGFLPGHIPPNMKAWATEQVSNLTSLIDFTVRSKETAYSNLLKS
jgi:hypothetical protein